MSFSPEFIQKQKERLQGLLDILTESSARSILQEDNDNLLSSKSLDDVGSALSDFEMSMGALGNRSTKIHEIQEALLRIQSGVYGICELTGKEIHQDRLEYLPWARFTVEAQAQQELKSSSTGRYSSMFDDDDSSPDEDEV